MTYSYGFYPASAMVIPPGGFTASFPLHTEHLFRNYSKSVRYFSGITVRFRSEQVFDLLRNDCSTWPGIRILTAVYVACNPLVRARTQYSYLYLMNGSTERCDKDRAGVYGVASRAPKKRKVTLHEKEAGTIDEQFIHLDGVVLITQTGYRNLLNKQMVMRNTDTNERHQ